MKFLNLIAAAAFAIAVNGLQAQSCGGHAKAAAQEDGMSMLVRELDLSAEQQKSVSAALDACHKDCEGMASASTKASPEELTAKRTARFSTAVESMKASLKPEQSKKLDELHASGRLASMCGTGSKAGCCAGKAAKSGGCCAGKSGHAPAKAPSTSATPSIQ
jgi:hypothetical protein